MSSGNWTDPDRGKVKLEDYAATWITQRPGLRPRTVDLYQWLLRKHIANGASLSIAAKAYRLLRAIITTAVDEDGMLPRNPCRIKGAGDEHAAKRPVLTVRQVYDLASRVGMRPVGNIRSTPDGYRLRFARHGVMRTSPERYATRAEAERALWKMAGHQGDHVIYVNLSARNSPLAWEVEHGGRMVRSD